MPHSKHDVAQLLRRVDLGASVAEFDTLLEAARIETSVFSDILSDRVDLVPGTKGSGKTALFRMIVDFLPSHLLERRRIVVAHGVTSHGDDVFQAHKDQFEKLTENDFVDFWCIYFASLANEHFVKAEHFESDLAGAADEVKQFRNACADAHIPNIKKSLNLRSVLEWVLAALKKLKPGVKYDLKDQTLQLSFGEMEGSEAPKALPASAADAPLLPRYVGAVRESLDFLLKATNYQLWLMVDRLDEIFLRRSEVETRALRALMRTMQVFRSERISIKAFLRDDILDQITGTSDGFTALTHVAARQSDRLHWNEEQILTLIVKRLFASEELAVYLDVDRERLAASSAYQSEAFYRVFPPTVYKGTRKSSTLRWIYSRTMDGRGVVTPRDVIDLITRAKQKQSDDLEADAMGQTDELIGSSALVYGLQELSGKKRDTFLKAEFPHFWPEIERFSRGKAEYTQATLKAMFGKGADVLARNLNAIGFLREITRDGQPAYQVPYLFRHGLQIIQGRA